MLIGRFTAGQPTTARFFLKNKQENLFFLELESKQKTNVKTVNYYVGQRDVVIDGAGAGFFIMGENFSNNIYVEYFDFKTRKAANLLTYPARFGSFKRKMIFSPDKKTTALVLTGNKKSVAPQPTEVASAIYLFDAATRKKLAEHRFPASEITTADWKNDGTEINFGTQAPGEKAEVYSINTATGKLTAWSAQAKPAVAK